MADQQSAHRGSGQSSEAKPERSATAGPGAGGKLALGMVRVIALIGVVALAVAAAAILVAEEVDGWIVGLVVGVGVQALTMFVLFSRRFASRS